MSFQAVPATSAYRRAVATAAASGSVISKITHMAFGTGGSPYSPASDTALQNEFTRVACTNTVTGTTVRAKAAISGAVSGARTIREVGVFTASGVLVGRRVMAPKELEPEAEIEIELDFEY